MKTMKILIFLSILFTHNLLAQTSTVLRQAEYPILHYSISENYPYNANVTVIPPLPVCEARSEEKTKDSQKIVKKNKVGEEEEEQPISLSNVVINPEDTIVTISAENQQKAEEAKRILEAQLASKSGIDFEDEDEFFRSITGEPPPNCQYGLRINTANVNKICQAMDDLANDRAVRESARCHVSNCSTASYLAMIQIAKTRSDWSSIQSQFTCRSPFPAAYRKFVGPNGLQAFMQEYNLGDARRIRLSGNADSRSAKLQSDFAEGFPRKSDPILLQRDQTKGGTGHSVIFSHFETSPGETYDPENPQQISKICYWSSNQGTSGTSNRCENVSYMSFIDAAHLKS